MLSKLKSLVKNPKVQSTLLVAAGAAAGVYGGPAASAAVAEYLPKLAALIGF